MPTLTYEPIASINLLGSSSYTFNSIDQSYTDLVLSGSIKSVGSGTCYLRLNGATSGYDWSYINRSGGKNSNDQVGAIEIGDLGTTSLGSFNLNINNYSATTLLNKCVLGYHGWEGGMYYLGAGLRTSSAITSITIFTSGTDFASPSRVTLFGIRRFT
jgi:hypothetical protein